MLYCRAGCIRHRLSGKPGLCSRCRRLRSFDLLVGLGAYPLGAPRRSTGSALTAAHFCQTATKVSKKALPLRTAFASLKFPRSGPAPWARRDGPSMAQHGSPGIHAGRPTPRHLHSASRRGGRSRSKTRSQADQKLAYALVAAAEARCCDGLRSDPKAAVLRPASQPRAWSAADVKTG